MRYIVFLIVLLLGGGFVFLNWTAVNTPVEVDLLIAAVKAPISLILLFWFVLLFLIASYCLFLQQSGFFATMRRLSKELEQQRKLATDTEASRLTDVKADFEKKWAAFMDSQRQVLSDTEKRLTEGQSQILSAFKESQQQADASNKELAASISSALDTMDNKISKILISGK